MDATGPGTSQFGSFVITRVSEREAQEKIDANIPDYTLEFQSSVTTARQFFSKGMDIPKTGVLCLSKTESDMAGHSVYFFCRPGEPEAVSASVVQEEAQTRALWKGELQRRTKSGAKTWVTRDFVLHPGKLRYYNHAALKHSYTLCGRTKVVRETMVDGEEGHFVVIKLNNNEDPRPVLLDAINPRRQKMFVKALTLEISRLRHGRKLPESWERCDSRFEVHEQQHRTMLTNIRIGNHGVT